MAKLSFTLDVETSGDLLAAGGFRRILPAYFVNGTVPASQTKAAMTGPGNSNVAMNIRAGSLAGLGAFLSSAAAGAALTVTAQRSSNFGGAWTDLGTLTIAIAGQVATATFAKDLWPIPAGDVLRLVFTTPSGWTSTSNNLTAYMEVEG